jgi:hypothetical protein
MPTEIDAEGSLLYTMTMQKQIAVSQLLATPEGQYVNGTVTGYLTQIRPPNSKGPSKGKLSDGSHEIEVSLWGGGVSHWEGQQVTFSGKGMKIAEYKGTKSLSIGDKVMISAASGQPDHIPGDPPQPRYADRAGPQGHPDESPTYRPPEKPTGAREQSFQSRNHPVQGKPANTAGTPVNGALCGMAVKAAVDIWLATRGDAQWNNVSGEFVEDTARSIILMSERIQSGQPTANPENVPF